MLQTLKDEEAEDIKQRDWCIEERDTERNNRDDLLYDIKQLENKIDRAELKKKKHNGATDGVIALLKTITENLQNEVAVAIKAEAKATEEFLALTASAKAQDEAYANQITDLEAAIADTDAEIEADTNTKTDTTGEKDATLEYLDKIRGY